MKRVVVIGGGTGTFVVLTGLKEYDLDISAVVSMMDSGGSTGRLRDQLGVLPPGDARQCLVALSEASDLWRQLFLYRFKSGDLKGHNFGNIFLTALEKKTKNYKEVIDTASYILKTRGKVLPVTHDKVNLCVKYDDGEIIERESLIDTASHKKSRIELAYLKPKAKANPEVIKAIQKADVIIISPGDLYTSIIPNLVVIGVRNALKKSSAKLISIMNLMTKRGQTTNYTAQDHISDLEHYLGKKVDVVLLNSKGISKTVRSFYHEHGEKEVVDDLTKKGNIQTKNGKGRIIVRMDLLSNGVYNKAKSDKVFRSILRHDSEKLGKALWNIIKS